MPVKWSNYPSNWKEISAEIRARAGGICEWCAVPDGALILRSVLDGARYLLLQEDGNHYTPAGAIVRLSEMPKEYALQEKYTKIILTVHHVGIPKEDGTPGDRNDKSDNRPANLAALCQRCHLIADSDIRAANAKRTRFENKHRFQLRLPLD